MDIYQKPKATEEQIAYAKLLNLGMKAGLLILVVMFFVYMSGILPPHIPVEKLTEYWGLPVGKYLEKANVHGGWSWLYLAGKGDFLNFAGIVFLSSITVFCFIRIVPVFLRKRDYVYMAIAIIEVAVLTLAASGLLKSGGH